MAGVDFLGTNGISAALWAGEPVFVQAAEHFCVGMSIRDPSDGKIIGVIDLQREKVGGSINAATLWRASEIHLDRCPLRDGEVDGS